MRNGKKRCRDQNKIMVQKKYDGVLKSLPYCEWIAEKPEKRCKVASMRAKPQIVKYTIKKKNGETKQKKRRFTPWKKCGCTCAGYIEDNTTPTVKTCPMRLLFDTESGVLSTEQDNVSRKPVEVDSMLVNGQACVNKGFEKGTRCDYDHMWTGCTYEALQCQAIKKCTCYDACADPADPNDPTCADRDEWSCSSNAYPSCPSPERPSDNNPNPVNLVPSVSGYPCQPGDPKPMEQESNGENSLLGI